MRIALCVGHSRLRNGYYTSADGTQFGGCNEYKYNKKLAGYLAKELKKSGHRVDLIVCPEKRFTRASEERTYKLSKVNNGKYDLCIELHLNALGPAAEGAEVLYVSAAGKKTAVKVQAQLATLFKDRGVKKRDNLYMLNATRPTAIMIETFFCTSAADYKKGKDYKKIARLIAAGIK